MLTLRGAPPDAAPAQPLRPGDVHGSLSVQRWWALADVVQAGAQTLITNEAEGLAQLTSALQDAVGLQSLADVPLGAFLSGGVDSSAVVAVRAQRPASVPGLECADASTQLVDSMRPTTTGASPCLKARTPR